MKTLVVYNSQTGFTKKYAYWINEAVDGDIFELSAVMNKPDSFFDEYDKIVYGGWSMGGQVVKVEWFHGKAEQWKEKKLAVFCCGATPYENPDIQPFLDSILSEEEKKNTKAFYCPGGVNYKGMKLFSKLAMKAFVSMLRHKQDKTQKEIDMMNMLAKSYDITEKKYADAVVEYLLKD